MKLKLLLIFVLSFLIIANNSYTKFNINAELLLQDYLSGEILYENPDQKYIPPL